MMQEGEFCFSLTDSEQSYHSSFKTKEEAIVEGKNEAKFYKKDKFYVGEIKTVALPCVDVDYILDNCTESMIEEYGEVAESYLCCLPQEDRDSLQNKLDDVFHKWLIDNNHVPDFFAVKNVEEVKIGQGDD